MNRFLSSVNRIVCTSPNYFATSSVLPRFADKVDVIPIGIEESSYPDPPRADKENVNKLYGSDFFLFVGVLRYYKGLHILLDAMRNARYRVVIVGSEIRSLWRHAARRRDVQQAFDFHGSRVRHKPCKHPWRNRPGSTAWFR